MWRTLHCLIRAAATSSTPEPCYRPRCVSTGAAEVHICPVFRQHVCHLDCWLVTRGRAPGVKWKECDCMCLILTLISRSVRTLSSLSPPPPPSESCNSSRSSAARGGEMAAATSSSDQTLRLFIVSCALYVRLAMKHDSSGENNRIYSAGWQRPKTNQVMFQVYMTSPESTEAGRLSKLFKRRHITTGNAGSTNGGCTCLKATSANNHSVIQEMT